MIKRAYVCGVAVLVAVSTSAMAQEPSPAAPPAANVLAPRARNTTAIAATQARYQIRVMEGVLENAVQHGAQIVTMQLRQVAPDMMVFSGPARARGYRLDGYGVFFSIDVPAVRRSVTWSFRTLNQGSGDLTRAMQALRRAVQNQGDARTKAELERALRLVELQVGPLGANPASDPALAAGPVAATAVVTEAGTAEGRSAPEMQVPPEPPSTTVRDPDAAYEAEVKQALIDAMLDYGPPLNIGDDEWLTIAARDTEDRLVATELGDTVTIVLRIRGDDLAGYRAGRLTRDQARDRVELREF